MTKFMIVLMIGRPSTFKLIFLSQWATYIPKHELGNGLDQIREHAANTSIPVTVWFFILLTLIPSQSCSAKRRWSRSDSSTDFCSNPTDYSTDFGCYWSDRRCCSSPEVSSWRCRRWSDRSSAVKVEKKNFFVAEFEIPANYLQK